MLYYIISYHIISYYIILYYIILYHTILYDNVSILHNDGVRPRPRDVDDRHALAREELLGYSAEGGAVGGGCS